MIEIRRRSAFRLRPRYQLFQPPPNAHPYFLKHPLCVVLEECQMTMSVGQGGSRMGSFQFSFYYPFSEVVFVLLSLYDNIVLSNYQVIMPDFFGIIIVEVASSYALRTFSCGV